MSELFFAALPFSCHLTPPQKKDTLGLEKTKTDWLETCNLVSVTNSFWEKLSLCIFLGSDQIWLGQREPKKYSYSFVIVFISEVTFMPLQKKIVTTLPAVPHPRVPTSLLLSSLSIFWNSENSDQELSVIMRTLKSDNSFASCQIHHIILLTIVSILHFL